MSRVVFMCGPAGSGKSTVARQLESQGMHRLSFDRTAWEMGHRAMPLPAEVREAIERQLRARLIEIVEAGDDVVLDFSFWSRAMRDDWREALAPYGIVPEIHLLSTPRDVALSRIRVRTTGGADDFHLDEATAAQYFDHFEPPTPDEGSITVHARSA